MATIAVAETRGSWDAKSNAGHLNRQSLPDRTVSVSDAVSEFTRTSSGARTYFSNLTARFARTNLPETVKGALFARYSDRKVVRRVFLDEFLATCMPRVNEACGVERRKALRPRISDTELPVAHLRRH